MLQYLTDRLSERSTWFGLIGFLTAAGWSVSPEQAEAIAALGVAAAGAVGAFFPDPEVKVKKQHKDEHEENSI